jgi:glyoxylase-like metal-dependent hydrolase (beta-lactamase superfamily II)
MSFPKAQNDQAYVRVSAIDAGELTLQEKFFVTDPTPGAKQTVPSLSFLIQHGETKLVFDGGLRHGPEDYKPQIAQRIKNSLLPFLVTTDAAGFLKKNGLDPGDVDLVMLSHVHYDHVGDPSTFPNARYVVGSGAIKTMQGHGPGYEVSLFESDLFDKHEVVELPSSSSSNKQVASPSLVSQDPNHVWRPLGPFPAALDFFGDGSLYVIDAPGHMEGHINVLARTQPTQWVYLGGDACHDPRILRGEKGVAVYQDIHGHNKCAHHNKDVADETVARIRTLLSPIGDNTFEVVLAHDHVWYANNRHCFFPNSL